MPGLLGYRYFFATSGGTTGPTPGGGSLLEAMRNFLKANTNLASLTDVYLRRPAFGASPPYLIISPINTSVDLNTGAAHIAYPEIQASLVASDDETAWSLGESAFFALHPYPNYTKLSWNGGSEATRLPIFYDRLTEQPGRLQGNKNAWIYTFGYRFQVSRSF